MSPEAKYLLLLDGGIFEKLPGPQVGAFADSFSKRYKCLKGMALLELSDHYGMKSSFCS